MCFTRKQIKRNKCGRYKNSCMWVYRTDVGYQPSLSRQKAGIHKQILNKTWQWWQAMAPHPILLPCALAFPPPIHRDVTTPSPCWAPHFAQERIMFSNPTPSKPHLSPLRLWATTRCWLSLRLALFLYLAACNPSSSCRFWVLDHLCSNLSQLFHFCWITEIQFLNMDVCFYLFLFCHCFSDRNELQL